MSDTIRAIRIREPGPPEVLELTTLPMPEPGPGELRVRVAASGLNRADLLQRLGRYPAPEGYAQDIPGMEISGVVDAVGPGLEQDWEGRRVMAVVGGGGYADHVLIHSGEAVTVPDQLDLIRAAAVPEVFATAFDALVLQAGLRPDETLLIHAVGSGVGTAALQLAKRIGARVIGTSRTREKLAAAEAMGLDVGVVGDEGWSDSVIQATSGSGVDVVLDLVGAAYARGNQRALGQFGRWMVVGIPGGAIAEVDLGRLMRKRATLRGTVLRSRGLDEKVALARSFEAEVVPGLADGTLQPVVDRVLPAEDAAEGHRVMESNLNFGKILLRW